MTDHPMGLRNIGTVTDWQSAAWDYYDKVGALRSGVGWLANAMSRVNLVCASVPERLGDDPRSIIPPDPEEVAAGTAVSLTRVQTAAIDLVSAIANGPTGQGQLFADCATHLTVPGAGWVVMESTTAPTVVDISPYADAGEVPEGGDLTGRETWVWHVLGMEELKVVEDHYERQVDSSRWEPLNPGPVVKFWRRHPRRSWEADSACRAALTDLRQIELLDAHVDATAVSRLAGAGLLVIPTEATFAPIRRQTPPGQDDTTPEDDYDNPVPIVEDDLVTILIDAMTTPIADRGTAAASVPLILQVPGDLVDKVQHLTFWSEFSGEIEQLRKAAVERLAIDLDMPPEVLTGMGNMNHWGAWQVEETAITLHIEPMAEVICHALTIGYLRPALLAQGFLLSDVDSVLCWYDTTDLTTRPDRSADAGKGYDATEVSGDAWRREAGLSNEDAPEPSEIKWRALFEAAKSVPALWPEYLKARGIDPGNLAAIIAGSESPPALSPPPAGPSSPPPAPAAPGPPPPPPDAPVAPTASTASAVVEACDALVYRALERAGGKLRSAIGRSTPGGAAGVQCPDTTRVHVDYDATQYASLESLLEGAWTRVPTVAARLNVNPDFLQLALDNYTRGILAARHPHDADRLAEALGLAPAA